MNIHTMGKLTVSVEEAGRLIGIGRSSVYEAIRRGELPSLKIGRRILVPRSALVLMFDNSPGDPADPRN